MDQDDDDAAAAYALTHKKLRAETFAALADVISKNFVASLVDTFLTNASELVMPTMFADVLE